MARIWKLALTLSLLCALAGAFAWRRAAPRAALSPAPGSGLVARPAPELREAQESAARELPAPLLEVRVEMPDGQPAPGATLELFQRDPALRSPGWTRTLTAQTDDAGRAELAAGAGDLLISAHKPSVGACSRPVWSAGLAGSAPVVLVLRQASAVSGRLLTRRGEEVADGRVTLARWAWGSQQPSAPDGLARDAVADAHGRFSVDALEPGDYQLTASAAGLAPKRRFIVVPAPAPLDITLGAAGQLQGVVRDEAGRGAASVKVSAIGDAEGTALTSPGGAYAMELAPRAYRLLAISSDGRVASAGPVMVRAEEVTQAPVLELSAPAQLTGRVLASLQRVVPGATISATPLGGEAALARTKSGGMGAYTLDRLPAGRYAVRVEAPGFNQVEQQLALAAGQRAALDFTLSSGGAIAGIVRDASGAPVADARVLAGKHVGTAHSVAFTAETTTGPDGRYLLDGVPSGPARVMAMRAGAAAGPSRLVDVLEEERASADFILAGDGVLTGFVSTADRQAPRAPWVVRIKSEGQQIAEVPCGEDGGYRVVLGEGDYQVAAWRIGAAPADGGRTVHIAAAETARADLTLPEEATEDGVRLRVTDLDGAPAAGATAMVQVQLGAQRVGLLRACDEEGVLDLGRWDQIPAPRLQFGVVLDGRSGSASLDRPGLEARLQLLPAASIRGSVRGADATTALTVSLAPAPDNDGLIPVRGPPVTFVGSAFTLESVAAAPVIVSVSASGGRHGEARVSLQPGVTSEVELTLGAPAGVRGRLVDPQGHALPGLVRVDARSAISAGADGSFAVDDLAPGPHSLSAWMGARYPAVERAVSIAEGATTDLGAIVLAPAR